MGNHRMEFGIRNLEFGVKTRASCFSALRIPHSTLCTLAMAATLLSSIAPGCIGPYRIGHDSLYPADVKTVYVPVFESESFRRHLGEKLTEAVCKQIETDTPFKVVNSPNADSVLSGRIVNDTKRVIVENTVDDPRNTEYNLQIVVTWANRKGDLIRENVVPVPPALVDIGGRSDIVPEFGRSLASEQQTAIDRLARQIVGLMEAPW
jgi:phenylalanyl-tRNA synthetase beta subunit